MKKYIRPTKGKAWAKQYSMRSATRPGKGWATPYNVRALSGMLDTDPMLRMFALDLGQGGRLRAEIVKRLTQATIDVQLEHHICLVSTLTRKLFFFYNQAKSKYYFVCCEYQGRRIRTSIIYSTRSRALWHFNQDQEELTRITWEEDDWIGGKEHIEVFPS